MNSKLDSPQNKVKSGKRIGQGKIEPNRSDTPMDTESNINVEEHQESPIDEVHETAKMKHIDNF